MNPLRWPREVLVAGLVICLLGAIGGLLFAWMESPLRRVSVSSVSGEWADYSSVFLVWLQHGYFWCPWALAGAIIAGLAFYAARLLWISK